MSDTKLPTLPGEFSCSGCSRCVPGWYATGGRRLHEGHFSINFGDAASTVTVDGEQAFGIHEVIIDRTTRLATVWVYPIPLRRCDCGEAARLEVWCDVPGVAVQITHGASSEV